MPFCLKACPTRPEGLVSRQFRLVCDRFPSPMSGRLTEYWLGQSWGLAGMGGVSQFPPTDKTGFGFLLPFATVRSIDSIKYTDTTGATVTLDQSVYIADISDDNLTRILPAFGKAWPTTLQQAQSRPWTWPSWPASSASRAGTPKT